ncbi:MAG: hypothetical protein ABGY41_22515, partial [Candidatus Poribacteria bacterium]
LFPHIDFEGIRLTVLAARLGISKQAVGQLVGELQSMGGGGATTFLTKLTTGLAVTYMLFVIVLGKMATRTFNQVGSREQTIEAISTPSADTSDTDASDTTTDTAGDTEGE